MSFFLNKKKYIGYVEVAQLSIVLTALFRRTELGSQHPHQVDPKHL